MQTCIQTQLLQMLGVTTIGRHSHVGTQALGEDRHRLVDVFLWHLFPNGLQSDCLGLSYASAGVYDTFPSWLHYVTVQWVQIWRA